MILVRTILFLVLLLSFSTQVIASNAPHQPSLKVGFVTAGPVNDLGWNYAHNQGRLYLEQALHGQIETSVVENVPESAEVERVMEKMIAQGNKVIFATAYGYLEPSLRVAARHPDVIIMHAGLRLDPIPVKNVGTYFADPHDLFYIAGIVAGRMTKKNQIGYVGAHPVPPLLVSLNAFTLGAHSVNPKVKVKVVWTNNWCNSVLETEATKSLMDNGVDIIFANTDSPITIVKTAETNGVYSIGPAVDLSQFAPKGWLTGAKWNWGPLYVNIVQSILDHSWRRADSRYGVKEGYVQLSSFGEAVPKAVQSEALAILNKIKDDKFIVFKGPIKNREGILEVPSGQTAGHRDLEKMDWVVAGVEGPIPKGK